MNPQQHDPLAQLADIHLPAAVPSFPWAWGWFAVLGAAALVLAITSLLLWRRRQANAYRRAALAELQLLAQEPDDQRYASAVNQLLRRVALLALGRDAAALSGRRWCDYLNSACKTPLLQADLLAELEAAAYRPASALTARSTLHSQVSNWLRKHRRALP